MQDGRVSQQVSVSFFCARFLRRNLFICVCKLAKWHTPLSLSLFWFFLVCSQQITLCTLLFGHAMRIIMHCGFTASTLQHIPLRLRPHGTPWTLLLLT